MTLRSSKVLLVSQLRKHELLKHVLNKQFQKFQPAPQNQTTAIKRLYTQHTQTMAQARDSPTEKCFSYRSLLLLFGVPLILFVVFNEALTSSASVTFVHAGQASIRGHRAKYETNITQCQTSNIQLKADLDALTNKQNAINKMH